MPSRSSKPKKPKRDFSQVAFDAVARLTGGKEPPEERPAAVKAALDDPALRKDIMREMGRRGGRKGGAARAATLSADERSAIASQAAKARWDKL